MLSTIENTEYSSTAKYLRLLLKKVSRRFVFIECNSLALLQQNMSIRHEVYCKEFGWQAEPHPVYEHDRYDPFSTHYVVQERSSGKAVAAFRIVQGQHLPVSNVKSFNQQHFFHPSKQPEGTVCELSRLSVLKDYRHGGLSEALILFSAFTTIRKGFMGVYTVMEKKLAKKLKKFGISVSQLTDEFEHNGDRAIFVMSNTDLFNIMSALGKGDLHQAKLDRIFNQLTLETEYCY